MASPWLWLAGGLLLVLAAWEFSPRLGALLLLVVTLGAALQAWRVVGGGA